MISVQFVSVLITSVKTETEMFQNVLPGFEPEKPDAQECLLWWPVCVAKTTSLNFPLCDE